MTRQTRLASLLGLGAALLLTSWAQAQPGRPGGGPPGAAPGGAPAAAGGEATVTNLDTTTTTTTSSTGLGGDFGTDVGATDSTALPKTGGEPLIMTLLGSLTAGGALLLRRKLS